MAIASTPAPLTRGVHPSAFTLALIGVGAAVFGLVLAYGINTARLASVPPRAVDKSLVRTVGGRDVTVPASWFRSDGERAEGVAAEVDLALMLPLGASGALKQVEITLMPRSKVAPTALLLDSVYLHQFDKQQLNGPQGLIGKPLVGDNGNPAEAVWYDALSANPFVAKCAAPVAEGLPSRCLRAVTLGSGIAAVYTFDADVLDNWKQFDAQLQPLMTKIGAV